MVKVQALLVQVQVQVQVQEKVNELDPEPQHTQFGTKSSPNGSRKNIADHSDQFLGFQNAAHLSRGVPTTISQLFQSPQMTQNPDFLGKFSGNPIFPGKI